MWCFKSALIQGVMQCNWLGASKVVATLLLWLMIAFSLEMSFAASLNLWPIQFWIHALGCENTRTSSAKNNHHLTRVIKNWFCGVHGVVMQPSLPKGQIGCPLGVCYEADGDLNDSQSGPSLLFCIWVGWTELVWCGSSWFRPSNVRLSGDVTTKIKWSKHTTVITGWIGKEWTVVVDSNNSVLENLFHPV